MIRRVNQRHQRRQAGDTLVEALLATVIISIVIAGAYTLANRATRINQQAFERTQVSKLMQQQAELIRAARDAYSPTGPPSQTWTNIISQSKPDITPITTDCSNPATLKGSRGNSFVIEDNYSINTTSIDARNEFFYVWSEVKQEVGTGDFYDFHVFACWEGLGLQNIQHSSIILRLKATEE